MAMYPGVSLITLGVADVARARGFYERLGWRCSQGASTPDVAFLAAALRNQIMSAPVSTEKNIVSQRITEKSMRDVCSFDDRCVRWCLMYSEAVSSVPEAMTSCGFGDSL